VIQIRTTLASSFHVIGGESLLRLANVGAAVLIGRLYGAATLGLCATILAVATIAERLADNGLEMTGIAEISQQPKLLNPFATALYVDKLVLSSIAAAILLPIALLVGLSPFQWSIALLFCLRSFLYSFSRLHAGFLKAIGRTNQIARIQSLHFALLLLGLSAAYAARLPLLSLLLMLVAAQSVEFLLSLLALRRLGARATSVCSSFCRQLFCRSSMVGAVYSLSTVMLRGDVLVLSLLASTAVVGAFAAANSALVMVYVVAWLFSGILLADLGRLSSDQRSFDAHFRRCLVALFLFSVPSSALAALLAPEVIQIIFGNSFASAVLPAAIMMLAVPFILVNAAFLARAIARDAVQTSFAIYSGAALLSLVLNFLLGRIYGAAGVATSIVLREAAMTFAFVRFRESPTAARPVSSTSRHSERSPQSEESLFPSFTENVKGNF
jgi:O-antigen/teichoic acid export membrane protein